MKIASLNRKTWPALSFLAVIMLAAQSSSRGAQQSSQVHSPDPAVLSFKLPDQIEWKDGGNGASSAVLAGDPSKTGLYVILVKWSPHHMSHPHFHPNDRFIYVISGTWWVGTGPKFDPDSTTPMPAGSFVRHFANQIHYDGAKDVEAVLEIVGEGPQTPTDAEKK